MTTLNAIERLLLDLRNRLRDGAHRIVFAESCTAGLVAALLGRVPGISQSLCGSMVVYQNECKTEWLGINASLLSDPKIGPVSDLVTQQLAKKMLECTPHATVAAAITGHLGPGASAEFDGQIFMSFAKRTDGIPVTVASVCRKLDSSEPVDTNDLARRLDRQKEAARRVLEFTLQQLDGMTRDHV